jgi:predicted glutamine amidotransferase
VARLFAVLGNRGELTERFLAQEADALRVLGNTTLGWGLGFVQSGELLMRRRPADARTELNPSELSHELKSDFLIGHVRRATVGALKPENTHPFRYRAILFAQTGTVERFEALGPALLEKVPEFLRSGIRGETDSEVVFNLLLSFLHELGALDEPSPSAMASALRSTFVLLDSVAREGGCAASTLNLAVGNGTYIMAVRRGAPMAIRTVSGRQQAEGLIGDDANLKRRVPELGQMHMSLLASDFGPVAPTSTRPSGADSTEGEFVPGLPWKVVPPASIVLLERGREPDIESL